MLHSTTSFHHANKLHSSLQYSATISLGVHNTATAACTSPLTQRQYQPSTCDCQLQHPSSHQHSSWEEHDLPVDLLSCAVGRQLVLQGSLLQFALKSYSKGFHAMELQIHAALFSDDGSSTIPYHPGSKAPHQNSTTGRVSARCSVALTPWHTTPPNTMVGCACMANHHRNTITTTSHHLHSLPMPAQPCLQQNWFRAAQVTVSQ